MLLSRNYIHYRRYFQPFVIALNLENSKILSSINALPNGEISDLPKSKAFADNKIKVTEKLKFVLERVKKIVGKGQNAGYQHLLLFIQYF